MDTETITPFDVQRNIVTSRKFLGKLRENSKSFISSWAMDDLVALGSDRIIRKNGKIYGQCIFKLDSKKANFRADIASELMECELYNTDKLFQNLIDFVSLHDFTRTRFCRRGFKNGRVTYTKISP